MTINIGLVAPDEDYTDVVVDYWVDLIKNAGVNINPVKYNNGQLGNEASMVDQLFVDSLDIYVGNANVLGNALPIMNSFSLPFLTRNVEDMHQIATDPEIVAATRATCEEAGVHYLSTAMLNPRGFSNHIHEIRSAEDMKGLTIRCTASTICVNTLTALGANPVSTALGETYTALQQGVVDGTDQDLSMGSAMRFYEIDNYLTEVNYQWSYIVVVASGGCWDKLTEVQQKALLDTAWEAQEYGFSIYEERQELSRGLALDMNPDLAIISADELTEEEYSSFTAPIADIYNEYRSIIGEDYFDMVISHTGWKDIL